MPKLIATDKFMTWHKPFCLRNNGRHVARCAQCRTNMVGRVHLVAGEGLEKATKQQKRSEQDEKIGSGFGSGFCFFFCRVLLLQGLTINLILAAGVNVQLTRHEQKPKQIGFRFLLSCFYRCFLTTCVNLILILCNSFEGYALHLNANYFHETLT